MDLRVMSPTSYQTALPRDGLFTIALICKIVADLWKSFLSSGTDGEVELMPLLPPPKTGGFHWLSSPEVGWAVPTLLLLSSVTKTASRRDFGDRDRGKTTQHQPNPDPVQHENFLSQYYCTTNGGGNQRQPDHHRVGDR